MRVAVVGASLGGLSVANVFHRLGATVSVFESSPASFEQRGACLGFVDVDLWQHIRGTQMTRGGVQASRSQGAFFYGDLWQFLYSGLPEGSVTFNHTVHDLGEDAAHPTINGEVYDLAVIADGGWSQLRRYVAGDVEPEYAGFVVGRARVDAVDLPGFDSSGDHEPGFYHQKNGIYDTMILPMPTDDGRKLYNGGIFIAMPEDEVRRPDRGASRHASNPVSEGTPEWFLPFVRRTFGRHAGGEIVRFFEAADRRGKITLQPQYEFAAEKTVKGRIVMVGDAAHMAHPRTAAGAHTAVLDAHGLMEAFDAARLGDIDGALRAYDRDAVLRAKALYRRSRDLSRQFLPPGGKGNVKQSPASLVSS